jgi:GT2 family glycosyltransferase
MLIAIGVPNGNNGNNEMMGTLAFLAHECGKMGHGMAYLGRDSCYVDNNRNEIHEQAQQIGADYLLFLDTDIELVSEGDIITHMLETMKTHNADIVTGVYYQGSYPYRPVVYNFGEKGIRNLADVPTEPFQVDASGGGFMLISKKVIDHFKFDKPGEKPWDVMFSPRVFKEDSAFCWRCKEAGFTMIADPAIKLNHWKRQAINEKYWQASKNKIVSAALDKAKDGGIDGWMSAAELKFLQDSAMKNETIVEIGSWKGRSTKAMLDMGAHVTAVDHWQGSDTIKGLADEQDVYAEFMRNVGHYPLLTVMKMPSMEAAAMLNGNMYDMTFIDAGHTYEDCKNDISAWLPRTKKLIVFHDFCSGWPGVMRAVKESFGDRIKVVDTIAYIDLQEK